MKSTGIHRPVVLLTGASSGLGACLSKILIDENRFRLILSAKKESLYRFKDSGIVEGKNLLIRPLDVTNAKEREILINEINSYMGGVDILINNAGSSYRAVIEHVTEEDDLKQMQVNFMAPVELARLVLPGMRAKKSGKIITVSSVGGMMAMPTMGIYSASKFALEGAFESLWYEVRPWNISVTLLQPGFINSNSFKNVKFTVLSRKSVDSSGNAYHKHYEAMSGFIEKLMSRSLSGPTDVAKKILKVMDERKPALRVPATLDAIFFSYLRRLLPRKLYHEILYRCLPNISRWGEGGEIIENEAAVAKDLSSGAT